MFHSCCRSVSFFAIDTMCLGNLLGHLLPWHISHGIVLLQGLKKFSECIHHCPDSLKLQVSFSTFTATFCCQYMSQVFSILCNFRNYWLELQTEPTPYGNEALSCNSSVCSFVRSILLLWILQESDLNFRKHCYILIDTENLLETPGGYLELIESNLELFM